MSGSAPEQIHLRAGQLSFAALSWGEPGARLALCLHGYPDTPHTFRHLGPHLAARGWRVVAPYLRGYAPSDLAPDGIYQPGALIRDAVELHRALGAAAGSALIGHDWGASYAYGIAALAPDRFEHVVAMAVLPPAALARRRPELSEIPLTIRQLRHSWYMGFQQIPGLAERALPKLIPRLWRAWSPGYDATEDVALVLDALHSRERATAALRYYRSLLQRRARSPEYRTEQAYWTRLPERPVLYLHGREDGCMLAGLAERAARETLPAGSRIEIVEGAGHFLQLERPQAVNELIAGFIG